MPDFRINMVNEKKIKIAIAEDHTLVRKGLMSLLKNEPAFHIMFDVGNGQELLNQLEMKIPDILLLDIRMPVMNGQEAMRTIHTNYPQIKVIIISANYADAYIVEFIKAGAVGFLPKSADIETVVEAIYVVYDGGLYVEDKFSGKKIDERTATSKTLPANKHGLSEREVEIIRLFCQEKTMNEIADLLFISYRTVEWHKKNIFLKTNSKTLVSLAFYAIRQGIIPNPDEAIQ